MYGKFIASMAHSIFMQDGPTTQDSATKNLLQQSKDEPDERVQQVSNADDWGSIAGGKTVEKTWEMDTILMM